MEDIDNIYDCTPSTLTNLTACFIPSSEAWCNIGDTCSVSNIRYDPKCNFFGYADQYLTHIIPRTFKCFNVIRQCVTSYTDAERQGCDILYGEPNPLAYTNKSNYWAESVLYDVDSPAILFNPDKSYTPWDFLKPFSWELWAMLIIVMCIITPLVTSLIEYDTGETVVGNFIKYLPDSIHAHLGIDLISSESMTNNTSYTLAVFINIFAIIMLALYSSNLVAYVLYKNYSLSSLPYSYKPTWDIFIDNTISNSFSELPNDLLYIDSSKIPGIIDSSEFDAIIGQRTFLQIFKDCSSELTIIHGPGIYKYVNLATKAGMLNIRRLIAQIQMASVNRQFTSPTCTEQPQSINLNSMYGVFLLFFIPMTLLFLITIIRFMLKRKFSADNSMVIPKTHSPDDLEKYEAEGSSESVV